MIAYIVLLFLLLSEGAYSLNRNKPSKISNEILDAVNSQEVAEHPFVVLIAAGRNRQCSGSLYKPNVVLTSASCIKLKTLPKTVNIGSSLHSYAIRKVKIHPNYKKKVYANDIAILFLKKNVKSYDVEDDSIENLVTLPFPNAELGDGTNVKMCAWTSTKKLRCNSLTLISQHTCQLLVPKPFPKKAVCARAENTELSKSDYGGPLLTEDKTLVGIASHVPKGGKYTHPGVYTDVCAFVDWIDKTVSKFFKKIKCDKIREKKSKIKQIIKAIKNKFSFKKNIAHREED